MRGRRVYPHGAGANVQFPFIAEHWAIKSEARVSASDAE